MPAFTCWCADRICCLQTMHDIKKNIPGTDAHAMHNPTRGTGDDGVKNAVKVGFELQLIASAC